MTYRPSELEWEPNGIHEPIRLLVGQVHRVVAQHGRHHVAERTPRVGVDDGLVVLQADAKPRLARSYAFARLGVRPTAAADAGIVPAPVVAERFETELEDAGTVCLEWEERRRLITGSYKWIPAECPLDKLIELESNYTGPFGGCVCGCCGASRKVH